MITEYDTELEEEDTDDLPALPLPKDLVDALAEVGVKTQAD